MLEWFSSGNHLELGDDVPQGEYAASLAKVKGLADLAARYLEPKDGEEHAVAMELVRMDGRDFCMAGVAGGLVG